MACLGVLFSVGSNTVDLIENLTSDEERIDYVKEILEEDYFHNHPTWVAELVKAWDALHRSLTDGGLDFDNGEFPLSHVVLGGKVLCANEDYIIVLKSSSQVAEIAEAVSQITRDELQQRYFQLDPEEYGDSLSEDDFNHTWEWFDASKNFWVKASEEGRSVLFTVDQ